MLTATRPLLLILALIAALLPLSATPARAEDPAQMWFPMQTVGMQYSDTWGAARGSGRSHTGTDVMAPQMNEVYAATDGTIFSYEGDCKVGEQCNAYYLLISGDDGRSYFYVHLNNDTPGRPNGCDGRGGIDNAFSPRLVEEYHRNGGLKGVRVKRGEHIAFNGSSGNAGCGVDHVHFEIWNGHGWGASKVNPYSILRSAEAAGNVWGADGPVPEPVARGRVAGDNRVRTSVELSKAAFTNGAKTAVIAPGEVYPEALLAAPLAATVDGPVLLTWNQQVGARDVLDDAVAAELKRLGVERVVIVGSTERLDAALEDQLKQKVGLGKDAVRRIAAPDRYALSAAIADEILGYHGITDGDLVTPASEKSISPLVALGEHADPSRGWPDALAATALAAREVVPILLTRGDVLPDETRKVLQRHGIGEVRIVGGEGAISAGVQQQIADTGHATRRIAGSNRFITSLLVADEMLRLPGVTANQIWAATGGDYPDALAAGQSAAVRGLPIVLIDGRNRDGAAAVYEWARDHAGSIQSVLAVGGPNAVQDDVLLKFARCSNWAR